MQKIARVIGHLVTMPALRLNISGGQWPRHEHIGLAWQITGREPDGNVFARVSVGRADNRIGGDVAMRALDAISATDPGICQGRALLKHSCSARPCGLREAEKVLSYLGFRAKTDRNGQSFMKWTVHALVCKILAFDQGSARTTFAVQLFRILAEPVHVAGAMREDRFAA